MTQSDDQRWLRQVPHTKDNSKTAAQNLGDLALNQWEVGGDERVSPVE
jgi:hypothetical protein